MVKDFNKERLITDQILESEFTLLMIYAEGCKHCADAKPVFEQYANDFPEIQFLKANIKDVESYYKNTADQEQDIKYVPALDFDGSELKNDKGATITIAEPQFNEDGTPKMITTYKIPAIHVHHKAAVDENNIDGFIGGYDGNDVGALDAICNKIREILRG